MGTWGSHGELPTLCRPPGDALTEFDDPTLSLWHLPLDYGTVIEVISIFHLEGYVPEFLVTLPFESRT